MSSQVLRRSRRHPAVIPHYVLDHTVYGEANPECPGVDRLPSHFNCDSLSYNLDIDETNLEVICVAKGHTDQDAGIVLANLPVPELCDVFYFEVQVVDAGECNHLAVGLCAEDAELEQLPGWGTNTWGYHGDDGRAFDGNSGNPHGVQFGPLYTANDVIGCGIDMQQRDIFYTKNGLYLGIAFHAIRPGVDVYPSVGLNSHNECMIANFGRDPFAFDIDRFITEWRMTKVRQLADEYKDFWRSSRWPDETCL